MACDIGVELKLNPTIRKNWIQIRAYKKKPDPDGCAIVPTKW